MRKMLTVALVITALTSFAQFTVTKNKVLGGADFKFAADTAERSLNEVGLIVPRAEYQFEGVPKPMLKLYFHAATGYEAFRRVFDGEPDVTDTFDHTFYLAMNPMVKAYFPKDTFVKMHLPFSYISYVPQIYKHDAIGFTDMAVRFDFGFDNREIEMKMLTPWDKFERGMAFYGVFDMGLVGTDLIPTEFKQGQVYKWETESADDLPMYFGFDGFYARFLENDDMIKAYMNYRYQLNEDAADKDTFLTIGALYARDLNDKFNLEADLNMFLHELEFSDKSDPDDHLGNYFKMNMSSKINYYHIPELNVFGGVGLEMDMSHEITTFKFELGATYTLDLMK